MNLTQFVERYREYVTQLMTLVDQLEGCRSYYDDVDVGGTLTDNDIPYGTGLTAAQFIDGVAAIDAIIAAGRITPVQRLRTRV